MVELIGEEGRIRRFGAVGPLYEVLAASRSPASDAQVRIRLIETGEEADYPLAQLADDPVVA